MNKFWKFQQVMNAAGTATETVLILNGYIAQESWFADDITPAVFKSELAACSGDITVWINSPGGDCFAASEIYTALKEYKGKISVKIDGVAASAASVVAMSGDMVEMSPTAMMMVHNPALLLYGEAAELEQGIEFLNEVKESIVNAYQLKTGLSRAKISKLMDSETWFNTRAAIEHGFCDRMMYSEDAEPALDNFSFDKTAMVTNTVSAMKKKLKAIPQTPPEESGTKISDLESRLKLVGGTFK